MRMTCTAFLAAAFVAASFTANAQSQYFQTDSVPVEAEVVANGLRHPWGLAFMPDGGAIVTEREGRIRILASDGNLSDPVEGVPAVQARGQGGLLDLVVSPDFESSGILFFSFSEPGDGGAGTAVARAKLVRDGVAARLDEVDVIFSMTNKTNTNVHYGSRLVLAPDGTLFITTGDRGERDRAPA